MCVEKRAALVLICEGVPITGYYRNCKAIEFGISQAVKVGGVACFYREKLSAEQVSGARNYSNF